MNGFAVINKETGVSSFAALRVIRDVYGIKKYGHTGTLDPLAQGVLPAALGRATRFIDFLPDSNKAYTARFKCGTVTDTLDITGKVLKSIDCNVTPAQVEAVLPRFTGEIKQIPPMYSALIKDGKRLYELARKGIEIPREARSIHISSLVLTGEENGEFTIECACSKGTYIRSLIADIGDVLGTGAVMTALTRTLSNGFSIDEAHTRGEFEKLREDAIIPLHSVFGIYPAVYVSDAQFTRFRNGGALDAVRVRGLAEASVYRVFSGDGVFAGLGEYSAQSGELSVLRVVSNDE